MDKMAGRGNNVLLQALWKPFFHSFCSLDSNTAISRPVDIEGGGRDRLAPALSDRLKGWVVIGRIKAVPVIIEGSREHFRFLESILDRLNFFRRISPARRPVLP